MKTFTTMLIFLLFSLMLLAESSPVPEKSLQEKAQETFEVVKQKTQELLESMQESANRALESARTKLQEFMNSTSESTPQGAEQKSQDWVGMGKNIIANFMGTTTISPPPSEN